MDTSITFWLIIIVGLASSLTVWGFLRAGAKSEPKPSAKVVYVPVRGWTNGRIARK